MKTITIHVKTNKPKTEILDADDDFLRVHVKAAPEKGKANLEIIKLFTKTYKKNVKIIKGLKSKTKVLTLGP